MTTTRTIAQKLISSAESIVVCCSVSATATTFRVLRLPHVTIGKNRKVVAFNIQEGQDYISELISCSVSSALNKMRLTFPPMCVKKTAVPLETVLVDGIRGVDDI